MKNLVVIGGGAAGFFGALAAKEANPDLHVILLEKAAVLLSKVRVSGGGRCNVTHACFDPLQLVKNYPRGHKELIGPFTRFQPRNTIHWFESRSVELKEEADGRMFPITDSSSTIIDCLMTEANKLGVDIQTRQRIKQIQKQNEKFQIILSTDAVLEADYVLLATGSSSEGHALAKELGHTIQEPVPSLFTFTIPNFPLTDLAGISIQNISINLTGDRMRQTGPLLITHWGFSGPAVLKLSAWAARTFHEKKYQVEINLDWIPEIPRERVEEELKGLRKKNPSQSLGNQALFGLPKNFWKRLLELEGIDGKKRPVDISNEAFLRLSKRLKEDVYFVGGKTTHKEEFVTCGGVTLSEVNFKTMESRCCPGLYFAGEVLDIDAVTGGFNFQNAWTTGWLAGQALISFN